MELGVALTDVHEDEFLQVILSGDEDGVVNVSLDGVIVIVEIEVLVNEVHV